MLDNIETTLSPSPVKVATRKRYFPLMPFLLPATEKALWNEFIGAKRLPYPYPYMDGHGSAPGTVGQFDRYSYPVRNLYFPIAFRYRVSLALLHCQKVRHDNRIDSLALSLIERGFREKKKRAKRKGIVRLPHWFGRAWKKKRFPFQCDPKGFFPGDPLWGRIGGPVRGRVEWGVRG